MGTLSNTNINVHHDVTICLFCEIAPGVQLSGKAKLGNEVFIGAEAVLLPNVQVGNSVIIRPEAVMIRNVEDNSVMVGLPARKINDISR
jgi:serine acetyltransferase